MCIKNVQFLITLLIKYIFLQKTNNDYFNEGEEITYFKLKDKNLTTEKYIKNNTQKFI